MNSLLALLTLGLWIGTVRCAVYLKPGDTFVFSCPIENKDEDALIQIYKDETKVEMFNTAHTHLRIYVSNDTELLFNQSLSNVGSYSLERNDQTKQIVLTITDVTTGDAGPWGCRKIRKSSGQLLAVTATFKTLFVEGPLLDLYWTTNTSSPDPLDVKSHLAEVDGASVVLETDIWGNVDIYCVIVVTNTEPIVNVTFGKYGEDGSRAVEWKPHGSFSHIVFSEGGFVSSLRSAERIELKFNKSVDFSERRPLYCRAELPSMTLEKSINIRVRGPPLKGMQCTPYWRYASEGDRNVKLTCKIKAFPLPRVDWRLPQGGDRINSISNKTGYEVENKIVDDGTLISTLVISEITRADIGPYSLHLVNELGEGTSGLFLNYKAVGDSVRISSSVPVMAVLGLLLLLIQ